VSHRAILPLQERDAIAHREGLVLIVRDIDDGEPERHSEPHDFEPGGLLGVMTGPAPADASQIAHTLWFRAGRGCGASRCSCRALDRSQLIPARPCCLASSKAASVFRPLPVLPMQSVTPAKPQRNPGRAIGGETVK
jgi:hypothetical protein